MRLSNWADTKKFTERLADGNETCLSRPSCKAALLVV